jgi:hypothetical protein
MLKRNWYYIFGGFFIVLGVLSLLIGSLLEGAWAITLGVGNLFVGYGQQHPEQARGPLVWALVILWLVIMTALTLMKLTTR